MERVRRRGQAEPQELLAAALARGVTHRDVLLALCHVADLTLQGLADAGIDVDDRLCRGLAAAEHPGGATVHELCEAAREITATLRGSRDRAFGSPRARAASCAAQCVLMLTSLALRCGTGMFASAMDIPPWWSVHAAVALGEDRDTATARVMQALTAALDAMPAAGHEG